MLLVCIYLGTWSWLLGHLTGEVPHDIGSSGRNVLLTGHVVGTSSIPSLSPDHGMVLLIVILFYSFTNMSKVYFTNLPGDSH